MRVKAMRIGAWSVAPCAPPGIVAVRDAARGFGQDRGDAHGPAAQLRALLLLTGGEERVEIDDERPQRHVGPHCKRRRGVKRGPAQSAFAKGMRFCSLN
jgi:hypothetical protein